MGRSPGRERHRRSGRSPRGGVPAGPRLVRRRGSWPRSSWVGTTARRGARTFPGPRSPSWAWWRWRPWASPGAPCPATWPRPGPRTWRSAASQSALDTRSIAVLYFEDGSGTDSLAYLADGLTEALIADLSAVPSLHVLSRNGALQFRNAGLSPDSIAREVGAGTVVTGDGPLPGRPDPRRPRPGRRGERSGVPQGIAGASRRRPGGAGARAGRRSVEASAGVARRRGDGAGTAHGDRRSHGLGAAGAGRALEEGGRRSPLRRR